MREVLLGIDCGTSAVKVCVFDRAGHSLRSASRPTPVVSPCHGWAEVEAESIWTAIVGAVADCLSAEETIVSVGLTGTCPTIVLMDEAARPQRNAILYLDNRAATELGSVAIAVGGAEAFFSRTGNRIAVSNCIAAALRWVKRQEPEVWRRTRVVGFLNTYVGARLTGVFAADPTHASYTGLYSLRGPRLDWDHWLAGDLGIDPEILPPLREPASAVGRVSAAAAAATGLPVGTPVAVGAADTAAAALAVDLVRPRSAFESAGTSGVLTFCLDTPDFDPLFMNRCHVRPGLWLAHGAMSTLGGALTWARSKVWPDSTEYGELEELAATSVPGANGVIFLPYLSGERSPIWDPNACGSWFGLRLGTTKADMVRAVYEGGAYGLRQILTRAEERWGWRPETLLSVGGGTRCHGWLQIKADVLGVAYRAADFADAAAMGAALLGGVAAGVWSGLDDPTLPKLSMPREAVVPSTEMRAVYDDMYGIYERLYPALRLSMAELACIGAGGVTIGRSAERAPA
jgi:xylulokinase